MSSRSATAAALARADTTFVRSEAPFVTAKAHCVMAGLDPAIHPPPIGSRSDDARGPAGGKMAGSSPAMTKEASAMTKGASASAKDASATTREARPQGLVLFAEDFDKPARNAADSEPEVIEPSFTPADLEAARAQAWQAGHDAASAEAAQGDAAAIRDALAAIAASLADAQVQAADAASRTADELARLLFDSFAVAFPALCAAYGEAELHSLIRTLLPALRHEPGVIIRVNSSCAAAIAREIEHLDPDAATRLEIVPTETTAPGNVRISWHGGQAVRDAAALWRQVAEILAPAGLLSYAEQKEAERVE